MSIQEFREKAAALIGCESSSNPLLLKKIIPVAEALVNDPEALAVLKRIYKVGSLPVEVTNAIESASILYDLNVVTEFVSLDKGEQVGVTVVGLDSLTIIDAFAPPFKVGQEVVATKKIFESASGDSPGGRLADIGEKLIVREVVLWNSDYPVNVSHPDVAGSSFSAALSEIKAIEEGKSDADSI